MHPLCETSFGIHGRHTRGLFCVTSNWHTKACCASSPDAHTYLGTKPCWRLVKFRPKTRNMYVALHPLLKTWCILIWLNANNNLISPTLSPMMYSKLPLNLDHLVNWFLVCDFILLCYLCIFPLCVCVCVHAPSTPLCLSAVVERQCLLWRCDGAVSGQWREPLEGDSRWLGPNFYSTSLIKHTHTEADRHTLAQIAVISLLASQPLGHTRMCAYTVTACLACVCFLTFMNRTICM